MLKSVGVSLSQFCLIEVRDLRERYPEFVRGHGKAPQHVAQLFGKCGVVDGSALEDPFPYKPEHLRRFLCKTGAGIKEAIAFAEGGIDRANRSVLILIEIHGQSKLTRGSAFA